MIIAHKPSLNIGSVNEQIKNKHQRDRDEKGEVGQTVQRTVLEMHT